MVLFISSHFKFHFTTLPLLPKSSPKRVVISVDDLPGALFVARDFFQSGGTLEISDAFAHTGGAKHYQANPVTTYI